MKRPPQLQLFPDRLITWETLTWDSQQSIQQLLSLLLEQALQRQRHESETNQPREENHV